MFERILLAVDGSDPSARAGEAARALATLSNGEVLVFHVRERELSRTGVYDLEAPDDATELVDGVVRTMKEAGVSARGQIEHAVHGQTARVILEQAKAFDAGVIVMGSRGPNEWSGLLIGSVAHKVIHLATVPVLVVT